MLKLMPVCFLWLLMTPYDIHAYHVERFSSCYYNTDSFVWLYFYAVCYKSNLTTVPNYLNKRIQGLYLSWNPIGLLRNNSFARYPRMLWLQLDRIPTLELESHALANLTIIKILDLSYSPRVNISNLYFPPSLTKLFLEGIKTIGSELRLSSLRYLRFLSLCDCSLSEVPSFGGNLPNLKAIDLSGNRLENFKFDSVAFLCRMVDFHCTEHLDIQNNCECLKLKSWLELRKKENVDLPCRSDEFDKSCKLLPNSSSFFMENFESCARDAISMRKKAPAY